MANLLELRPDSIESGLCEFCPHLVNGMCNTNKACGQVMACRSQSRALICGRYPSGRVRRTPLKRVKREKLAKVSAWLETYKKMSRIGDSCGCVWINFLPDSKQVSIRRLIKKDKISVIYVDGVLSRKKPAIFISLEDLNNVFGEGYCG